ncbi:ExbD/TolR family protein [Tepidicaulis sp.]|jgi:biopolymer transport protein ExbD|uniref:ExbD/TolR family protein n=1 Tax=Tepidicaulis sp. TaxID=1920809 RepID=UPI003B5C8575
MIEFEENPPRRQIESVVPLINVVFLLLIFFLLTGTLKKTDTVDVELPTGQVDDKKQEEELILYVEADGFVHFQDLTMDAQMAPYMLRNRFSKLAVQAVTVKADQAADAHDLIQLMEGLRNIGVKEVMLITQQAKE